MPIIITIANSQMANPSIPFSLPNSAVQLCNRPKKTPKPATVSVEKSEQRPCGATVVAFDSRSKGYPFKSGQGQGCICSIPREVGGLGGYPLFFGVGPTPTGGSEGMGPPPRG